MALTYDGTNGITFNDGSQIGSASQMGIRNRIINGHMVIDQRNAGASGTATGTYTLDRWYYQASQSSKGTWQQNAGSITPPAGFSNYLGFTSSSAYSIAAGDYFNFQQQIEGYNWADLAWGTSSASTVTLSFKVYSSLTGIFGGSIKNNNNSRSYPFTYTIPSANTWTTINITIPGCTDGTWQTTNSAAIQLCFGLGLGSTYSGTAGVWSTSNYISATGATSVVGTNGATWYITGIQLEKGSVATPFDYRFYGKELLLCQRYYEKSFAIETAPADGVAAGNDGMTGACYSASNCRVETKFAVTKRATPTVTTYKGGDAGTNGQWSWYNGSSWVTFGASNISASSTQFYNELAPSGRSFGQALIVDGNWTASAEL